MQMTGRSLQSGRSPEMPRLGREDLLDVEIATDPRTEPAAYRICIDSGRVKVDPYELSGGYLVMNLSFIDLTVGPVSEIEKLGLDSL